MMEFYTYGYEDYSGKQGTVTVMAENKEKAWEKLHEYRVSKGELHYAWFLSVSDVGEEKYYKKPNESASLALMIGLFGAALGCEQIKQYGINKNYIDALKNNETIKLIKD